MTAIYQQLIFMLIVCFMPFACVRLPSNPINRGDGTDSLRPDGGGACATSAQRPCTTLLPGNCSMGSQTCLEGSWGDCVPDLKPGQGPEICGNARDDDCDGAADDADSDCQPCQEAGTTRECQTGVPGPCAVGLQECVSKPGGALGWSECKGLVVLGAEVEQLGHPSCDNGEDDDCDGAADELDEDCFLCEPSKVNRCSTGLHGACNAGKKTCSNLGRWGDCVPNTVPQSIPEERGGPSCDNGVDDDCDGVADGLDPDCQCGGNDDCPGGLACVGEVCVPCVSNRECGEGEGCAAGVCGPCSAPEHCAPEEECQVGGFCVCVPSNGGVEICDDLDNDCDGEADEDETRIIDNSYQLQRCCNPPQSYWCCSPAHGGSESGNIGDCCMYWIDNKTTVHFSCD